MTTAPHLRSALACTEWIKHDISRRLLAIAFLVSLIVCTACDSKHTSTSPHQLTNAPCPPQSRPAAAVDCADARSTTTTTNRQATVGSIVTRVFVGQMFSDTDGNRPLRGRVVATLEDGTVVASTSTDAQGNFTLTLRTGRTYVLQGTTPSAARCAPSSYALPPETVPPPSPLIQPQSDPVLSIVCGS